MSKVFCAILLCISFAVNGQGIIDYVSKYSMEGNFNDSTTTHNGTGNATVSTTQHHDGTRAAYFDGVNDSIGLGVIPLYKYFTISLWAWTPTSTTDQRCYISNSTDGVNDNGFRLYTNEYLGSERNIKFNAGNGAASDNAATSYSVVTFGQWNHIVVTYDSATTKMRIYYNNNRVEVDSLIAIHFNKKRSVRLGLTLNNYQDFIGYLDDVRIYNFRLNSSQVDSLYKGYYPSGGGGGGAAPQLPSSSYIHYVDNVEYRNYVDDQLYAHYVRMLLNPENYFINNQWNFNNETLGYYTDAEIAEDMPYQRLWNEDYGDAAHGYNPTASIVYDTINGAQTKAMRIINQKPTPGDYYTFGHGFTAMVYVGGNAHTDYRELYLSFNFKFGYEFPSSYGGKLPGFAGLPAFGAEDPRTDPTGDVMGFTAKLMFKRAGRIQTYHYDRTMPPSWEPVQWGTEAYDYNTIYLNNGNWYNITERLVMNTFTGGTANADGIFEVWVDGRMMFQEHNLILEYVDDPTKQIDIFQLTHFINEQLPDGYTIIDNYGYIDNIKVYSPTDDPTWGTNNVHNTSAILITPDPITDKTLKYDYLVTTAGTLHNSQWGTNYSQGIDETWLIDAGAGHTVTYTFNAASAIGGGDYIFILDGNQTWSPILVTKTGYLSSVTGNYTSTGRYMFIRFSSDEDGGIQGFTGTITFN